MKNILRDSYFRSFMYSLLKQVFPKPTPVGEKCDDLNSFWSHVLLSTEFCEFVNNNWIFYRVMLANKLKK